jgi:DNA-binding GntR family transcriptional regulator
MKKEGKRLFAKTGLSDPLDQQIYGYLSEKISAGSLSGGDRLVEAELQKVFKVSRTPIREALRILTSRGLLEMVPGKGASVRRVSSEDIKEIYPVLANLEGLAASLAADQISQEPLAEMQSCLEQMESLNQAGEKRSYIEYHYRFHELYIQSCHNRHLIQIIMDLRRQIHLYRLSHLYIPMAHSYSMTIHQKILQLFREKSKKEVEELVKEHMLIAMDRFLSSKPGTQGHD